jgi:type VII secretion integral membrane protein EccD
MTTVSFPSRCAVAVICGEHLVSQVYPASVPIEVFMDNIVELLSDDLKRRGISPLDSGVAHELHRANGTRLDVTRTLDELGVEDGSTLMIVPAERGDSFEPQYESLSTGLARFGKNLFAPVTAQTAAHTAIGLLALIALTILALAVYVRTGTDSLAPSIVTGVTGLLLAVGAFVVWKWWPGRHDLLAGLAWPAIPLSAASVAAAAPGNLGGPHAFIAALGVAALMCGVAVLDRSRITCAATLVTLCSVAALLAAARMWQPVPAQWLGMSLLFTLLILVTLAPTVALWTARIRPPHFESITGRDLFQRGDGMPVDAVAPVEDDESDGSSPDTTPQGVVIADLAARANGVLTGICVAVAIALPGAAWAALTPGRPRRTAAAVLVLLFVLIFISRGRAFADRRQAVALVCGAAGAFCSGVANYVVHANTGTGTALLWGAVVLVGFGAAGLAAALLVPSTRFTPLIRMVTEWLELVAIVAALPLAAWIGGLFTWIRMR